MAFYQKIKKESVKTGCKITFTKYYYPRTPYFDKNSKPIGQATMQVEITKISDKANYSCKILSINAIEQTITDIAGGTFYISERGLFKSARFHEQGVESIKLFGNIYTSEHKFNYT